jgi:hypothetical protein
MKNQSKIMERTFKEIVDTPELKDGIEVNVRVGQVTFEGKIVGKSSCGLIPNYIVECMDGLIPNEVYDYKFVSVPISEIFIK